MEPWTDGLMLKPELLYHPELENPALGVMGRP